MPARTLRVGFVVVGAATVLIGPLLPSLSLRLDAAPATLGPLFVAQFTGATIGALLSPLRIAWSLRLGYLLVALGMVGLAQGAWGAMLAGAAVAGLGLGLVAPASNLLVAFGNPGRRGASLSLLNFNWGLGAVTAPLLLAALPAASRAWLGPCILAGAAGALAVVFLRRAPGVERAAPTPPGPATGARPRLLPDRPALALALVLALYIGAETAVGGWVVPAAEDLATADDFGSLLAATIFWSAFLVGRAAAPLALRALSEGRLHRVSLILATGGVAALVLAPSWAIYLAAAALAGLGLAPLFPLTMSRLAEAAEADLGRASGWMFAIGGLGGAVAPWLAAEVATRAGDLRYAFTVPLAALVGIAFLAIADPRRGRSQPIQSARGTSTNT
jgi:fucose permease